MRPETKKPDSSFEFPRWVCVGILVAVCILMMAWYFIIQSNKSMAIGELVYPGLLIHGLHLVLLLGMIAFLAACWLWTRSTKKRVAGMHEGRDWGTLAKQVGVIPAPTLSDQEGAIQRFVDVIRSEMIVWWLALPILVHAVSAVCVIALYAWEGWTVVSPEKEISNSFIVLACEYLVLLLLALLGWFFVSVQLNVIHHGLDDIVERRRKHNRFNEKRARVRRARLQQVQVPNEPVEEDVAPDGNQVDFVEDDEPDNGQGGDWGDWG